MVEFFTSSLTNYFAGGGGEGKDATIAFSERIGALFTTFQLFQLVSLLRDLWRGELAEMHLCDASCRFTGGEYMANGRSDDLNDSICLRRRWTTLLCINITCSSLHYPDIVCTTIHRLLLSFHLFFCTL